MPRSATWARTISLSFLEGLSLRPIRREQREQREGILRFQAETFIEAPQRTLLASRSTAISFPFRKGFH